MRRYHTRPGVVLTTVDEQYLLVASKSAREFCPYITQINDTAAFCWRLLEDGADPDALLEHLAEEYEIDDSERVRTDLQELLDQLCKANYLIDHS